MKNRTKEEILSWLSQQTRIHGLKPRAQFTTHGLAEKLSISRSLASQYLNELCKEKACIKVSSRPVYYFARKELEKRYQTALRDDEYFSIADLTQALTGTGEPEDFMKAVGADGSLAGCIAQIKSAMQYPEGLAVILEGEKGSGRRYLAQLAFEFLQNHQLIPSSARFCRMSIGSDTRPESQLEALFGRVSQGRTEEGLLEKCQDGLLYLADGERLSPKCQLMLAEWLSTGRYQRLGDNRTVMKSAARIMISVSGHPHEVLSSDLLLNIPVHCQIPPLLRRPQAEREALVIQLLLKEQQRLNREIRLSPRLFAALCMPGKDLNLHELNNGLKTLCANAYSEQQDANSVTLKLLHLPPGLIELVHSSERKSGQEQPLTLSQFCRRDGSDRILSLFDELLKAHERYYEEHHCFPQFLEEGLSRMRDYYDTLVFDLKEEDSRLPAVEAIIRQELETLSTDRRLRLPPNCGFVLGRMISALARIHSSLALWESQRREAIQSCMQTLRLQMPEAAALAEELMERLGVILEFKPQALNVIFLALNIRFYNQDDARRRLCGIIISHGYSTASSIADAANQLLEQRIFEAIDMPLDTEVHEIEKKLENFIRFNAYYQAMILMVDMGSLEEIAEHLSGSLKLGIINNISTGLALDIGMRIRRGEELETILRSACESYQCRYRIVAQKQKEKAIVFTNDISAKISGKLAELFARSLPRPLDLRFIEADYASIQSPAQREALFQRYDVLLLIGPLGFHPDNVNTMALEDIVSFRTMEPLNRALQDFLSEPERESFQQQLLKNFSLQSLMENLTILNPTRLLDSVYEAVSELQRQMRRRFQSRTLVGIYIHVSFLIERLVTRTAIESEADLTAFRQAHADFIEQVNVSFAHLLKSYSVSVPTDEISYLYDYIENDETQGPAADRKEELNA